MQRRDFKGNVYRRLLVGAIERNGGYRGGYHDRYALSWNVSIHEYVKPFDILFPKALAHDYGPGSDADLDPELLTKVRNEWDDEEHMNQVWDWVVESMRRGVVDADAYRTVRPEIAARYGLPGSEEAMPRQYKRRTDESAYHPAGREGWIKINPYRNTLYFDVEWEFAGRQGKHLCLTEFEGHKLDMRSADLAEAIRENESGYSNEWCQKLLAFIHECDLCFTQEAIREEFKYQMLYQLAQELDEVADETKRLKKEAAERQYWAERDVNTEGR